MMELKDGRYSYKFQDLLGTGSFGNVFKCFDKKDGQMYALKIVDKQKLNQYGDYLHMALQREIDTQKQATKSQIPFFVGLYDNFEDNKNIYIILEYCEKSLMDFLYKIKLNETQSLELIFQVALGLNYLHSVHITHRDIKPENILMKKGILKIADFGFASNSSQLMTNLGTAPYMSPELFQEGDDAYTHKVDVWALNTCLYKLLTGKLYFWSPNKKILEKQVLEKEFIIPDDVKLSENVKKLLEGGYMKDPSKRLSMQEYVMHPAFQQFHPKYSRFLNPTNISQQMRQDQQKQPSIIPQPIIPKPSFDQQMFSNFLNYRNNTLFSSFFAEFLVTLGFNKIIAFYLLKLSIQRLSAYIVCFKNLQVPQFTPFDTRKIDLNDFLNFIQTDQAKKLTALYIKDLTYLAKRYSELFKAIQLALEDGDQGYKMQNLNSLFNLNNSIDNKAVLIYIDKLLRELKELPFSHEDKLKLGEFSKNFITLNFQNPISLLERNN